MYYLQKYEAIIDSTQKAMYEITTALSDIVRKKPTSYTFNSEKECMMGWEKMEKMFQALGYEYNRKMGGVWCKQIGDGNRYMLRWVNYAED